MVHHSSPAEPADEPPGCQRTPLQMPAHFYCIRAYHRDLWVLIEGARVPSLLGRDAGFLTAKCERWREGHGWRQPSLRLTRRIVAPGRRTAGRIRRPPAWSGRRSPNSAQSRFTVGSPAPRRRPGCGHRRRQSVAADPADGQLDPKTRLIVVVKHHQIAGQLPRPWRQVESQ